MDKPQIIFWGLLFIGVAVFCNYILEYVGD